MFGLALDWVDLLMVEEIVRDKFFACGASLYNGPSMYLALK